MLQILDRPILSSSGGCQGLRLAARRPRIPLSLRLALVPLGLAICGLGCGESGTGSAMTPDPPGSAEPPPPPPPPAPPEPEPGPGVDVFDFPLRAVAAGGNWGGNQRTVAEWVARGRTGNLIPSDYLEWLASAQVNWVLLSVALHYDDSMDSTVERKYADVWAPSFSDDALRRIIREFHAHGVNVYLTLAFESFEARESERPVWRWQLGDPAPPHTGGVPPNDPAVFGRILPENWPWRPDHPDHQRFVAAFWETYTQQAVHIARIAEDEGVDLFSLGTETDRLFRTRPDPYDPNRPGSGYLHNDFGDELRAMVDRVRAVFGGRLTYDCHVDVLVDPGHFGLGSGAEHLWEDLDLDLVGLSGWFQLTDSPPSTVMDVASLQRIYEQIFHDYLVPLAGRNPGRAVVFLEYGAMDIVEAPVEPGNPSREGQPFVFSDQDGNGFDDGREQQANIFKAFFNTMERYPGVLHGAFFWNNWIASDAMWEENWAGTRQYSFRGKLAEEIVRAAYQRYSQN